MSSSRPLGIVLLFAATSFSFLLSPLLGGCENTPAVSPSSETTGPAETDEPPRPASKNAAIDPARGKEFWDWFARNTTNLATIKTADEPIAYSLGKALKRVHPGLTFEVGQVVETREIVISADGNLRVFPAVKELVAMAPSLPGWKVIAFRPRKALGLTLEVGGTRIDPKDVWFKAARDRERSGKLEVTLFVRGVTANNKEQFRGAILLLLDSVVGEYDVETKLGAIDYEAAPPSPESLGLRPLGELGAVVDASK